LLSHMVRCQERGNGFSKYISNRSVLGSKFYNDSGDVNNGKYDTRSISIRIRSSDGNVNNELTMDVEVW